MDDSFKLNSFIYAPSSFAQSDPSSYEIEDAKIRYCCSGTAHPENQLDGIIDKFLTKVEDSVIYENEKREQKFKALINKKLKNRKRKMMDAFSNKEEDCVYEDLAELE